MSSKEWGIPLQGEKWDYYTYLYEQRVAFGMFPLLWMYMKVIERRVSQNDLLFTQNVVKIEVQLYSNFLFYNGF